MIRSIRAIRLPRGLAPALAAALALASLAPPAGAQSLTPFGAAGGAPQAPWKVIGLPQQGSKPLTRFSVVDIDGKRAVKIEADESYANLVHPLSSVTSVHLAWQWRVEKPLEAADLRSRSGDDTAIKVCVFFDLPIDNIPFTDRQLLRLARSKTTDFQPTATICYVWDSHLAVGTTLDNAFTRRVRYMILESGNDRLNQWVAEKRDVGADFLRLFGDESKTVLPVLGVSVGADADNTKGHTVSYVSGIVLEP
jgi:Protein of unknown function (DUF3047)